MLRMTSLLMLVGCTVGTVPESPVPPPAERPRLVATGTESIIQYDTLGFPSYATGKYSSYRYSWFEGVLVAVHKQQTAFEHRTISAMPVYAGGRLVAVESRCSGACTAQARVDELEYTADGALARWTKTSGAWRYELAYTYDDQRRLVRIDRPGVTIDQPIESDVLAYDGAPCPHTIASTGITHHFAYAGDRLTELRYGGVPDVFPIHYNEDRISRFTSTGETLQELHYEQAEVRGLDVWPGHINGDFTYGFPAHGELFRLDGRCDPTLTAQPTILAMVIGSL